MQTQVTVVPKLVRIGELVEIYRSGEEELSIEWQISNFSSLTAGNENYYDSAEFRTGDELWSLILWPIWTYRTLEALEHPESECLRIALMRRDGGPPKTLHYTVGIKGFRVAEGEFEFDVKYRGGHFWNFCLSQMMEHKTRLMPNDTLTITCVLKRPGSARELLPEDLVLYSYEELQTATENFCDLPLRSGGYKIGEGGFGTVYRANVRGDVVAVKRLKNPVDKQFVTELKTLTNYKHENLLPLLGCCLGPPNCCLVYEYMPNGSLEDRLACKDENEPLSWQTRLSIAYGTALGINHLHTFGEEPDVHRDIKSANILLDQNFVPKVGDFGLVRTGSSGGSTTLVVTKRFCGTEGYMPREAYMGDVSVKWDTFSFGVVLLELLTGLPPYDPSRKDNYLITHMGNCEDILPMLDPKANWNHEAATELYRIAQRCLAESKKSRPTISEILEDLRNCPSYAEKNSQRSFFTSLVVPTVSFVTSLVGVVSAVSLLASSLPVVVPAVSFLKKLVVPVVSLVKRFWNRLFK